MLKLEQAGKIVLLMAIFALVPLSIVPMPADAAQIQEIILDPIDIRIDLDLNGTAGLTVTATCTNIGATPVTEVTFRIESTDISLKDAVVNGGPAEAEIIKLDRYSTVLVQFDESLPVNGTADIFLKVKIDDIQSDVGTSLLGDIRYIDSIFYVRPLSTYRNFTLTTFLPSQSTLSEESVSPIFPTALYNFTNGQSLAFSWFTQELQPGQEKVFIVRYQMRVSSTIFTGISDAQLLAVGAGCLILGLALGYMFPRIVERLQRLGRVRFVGVTSEEEEVLDVIRNKGGSCSQKDLYGSLNMSQSKVSLLLTALEERGLVRRFKDGRENTVHIIEQ